jgi:L-threonylcarbamoyladenylate synthase
LPAQPGIVGLVTSGLPTVAVRWSAHPLFAAVIEQFGKPLAAPSANRFGRISPTEAAHVASELGSDIPLILDGGSCTHGVESTIALPSEDGTSLSILRAGPISLEALAEFCPVHRHVPKSGHVPAPGFLAQHYAPSTPVLLVQNAATPANQLPDGPIGCLAFRHLPPPGLYERVEILSASGDLREAAATLFAKLRRLDAARIRHIVAELPPATGLGVAIRDRLVKAAGRGGEELPF